MTQRSALIGWYQLGVMDGVNEAANAEHYVHAGGTLNVRQLWLATLLQAGIERIDLLSNADDVLCSAPSLANRVKAVDPLRYLNVLGPLLLAFLPLHSDATLSDADRRVVRCTESFIMDLSLAAQRRSALIQFKTRPTLEEIEAVLPARLYLPIRALYRGLQEVQIPSVCTASSVDRAALKILGDLLSTDEYVSHVECAQGLDAIQQPLAGTLRLLRGTTAQTVSTHPALLRLGRVGAAALPVASGLVDAIAGKIAGTFAEALTKAFLPSLEEGRRIVIYDFSDLTRATMAPRVQELVRKQSTKPGAA